jgi:ABC-type phosphate transport system substrate-binding protein
MTVLQFNKGTTSTIWVRGITDSTGAALDITGWAVLATALGPGTPSPVIAEWSTSPTGTQGQATAAGSTIALAIPSAMSTAWLLNYAVVQISVTEPGVGGRQERFTPVGLIASS